MSYQNPYAQQPSGDGGALPQEPYTSAGAASGAYPQQGYAQPGYSGYGQPGVYAQPGAYPQQGYAQPYNPNAKSRTTAALLAFFLGDIGVHSFYRGQTGRGLAHIGLIVLGLAVFFIGIAVAASSTSGSGGEDTAAAFALLGYLPLVGNRIWSFVEFVMILASKDSSLV